MRHLMIITGTISMHVNLLILNSIAVTEKFTMKKKSVM
jgi:hypothetical protein